MLALIKKSKVINWKRLSVALFIGAAATSMIPGALHYWIGFPNGRIHPTLVHLPFIALSSECVAYFKETIKKHHMQYQNMIYQLLDKYVAYQKM